MDLEESRKRIQEEILRTTKELRSVEEKIESSLLSKEAEATKNNIADKQNQKREEIKTEIKALKETKNNISNKNIEKLVDLQLERDEECLLLLLEDYCYYKELYFEYSSRASLVKVSIPSKIDVIKERTFRKNKIVEEIIMTDSVREIEFGAFSMCTSLKKINLSNFIRKISPWTFEYCTSLEEIVIPDSVELIEGTAFSKCYSLKKVTFPKYLRSIGECAFNNCTSLEKIVIPDSVKIIKNSAFAECSSLTTVEMPKQTEIESRAFTDCPQLKKIIRR